MKDRILEIEPYKEIMCVGDLLTSCFRFEGSFDKGSVTSDGDCSEIIFYFFNIFSETVVKNILSFERGDSVLGLITKMIDFDSNYEGFSMCRVYCFHTHKGLIGVDNIHGGIHLRFDTLISTKI